MAQFYYFRPYLGIETVSSRLLLWMEKVNMKKFGQLLILCLQKPPPPPQKILFVLPGEICLRS